MICGFKFFRNLIRFKYSNFFYKISICISHSKFLIRRMAPRPAFCLLCGYPKHSKE